MTAKKQGSGGFKSSPGTVFGTLEQVFDDVWWVWGTVRFAPGIVFPRNMTIVREKGELVLIHTVMMPPDQQAKIEALGPIKHVVRLGAFHGMDDAKYVERYGATMWAPPDVDSKCKIDRELVAGGESPIAGATVFSFDASKSAELALIARGILFSCDSVQNWETTAGCSFLGGVMARVMGFRGRACIGPGWRKQCEPKDGKGFGPDFDRLLALDWKHAIGAHGPPMKDTAKDDLRASKQRIYKS